MINNKNFSSIKNKRIFFVVNARMPNEKAHGIQIAKMCEAFVEEGVDLELIVPNRKTHKEDIRSFYNLSVPIRMTKLPIIDFYNKGRVLYFFSSLTFMGSYFLYLLWKKAVRCGGIIYTVDMDLFSFALMPLLRMPVFTEMHSAKEKSFLYRLFFSHTRVITINSIIRDELMERFSIPEKNFLVEPNGVDLTQFNISLSKEEARKKLNIPQDKKVALYVGRVYQWKGLEVLSRAAALLPKDIKLYFLGGTKEEFRNIIGEKNSEGVNFISARPQNEMPLWLSAADALLVISTKNNKESYLYTSPMKIFEYLTAHRPIVASDTPAIKQILTEKEAVFCKPDDEQDLADKIVYTMGHTSFAEEIAKHGHDKAEWFSWNNRAKRIISFINLRIEG